MRTITIPEVHEALRAGKKIVILVESRAVAAEAFRELGGIKHGDITSVYIHHGVHDLRTDNGGWIAILPKADFKVFICGRRANLVILQNETFLTEEEMDLVRPLLASNEPDSTNEIVKIQ